MSFPLERWWKKDTALHSFVFCQFLIGLPFTVFKTYVIFQLQNVGYFIGTNVDGQPCTTYCIAPWAGKRLDLNSVLLYLNAIRFGVGGVATLLLAAYSDFWSRKHLLVTIFIIAYGAFSAPAYWLQGISVQVFQSLSALYIIFAVITFIIIASLNIYIPHCMRNIAEKMQPADAISEPSLEIAHNEHNTIKRSYGFKMSVFGQIATQVGGCVLLVVVIILNQTLSGNAATSAGLLVTTITGFVTIAGSVIAWMGLPAIPSKPSCDLAKRWSEPLVEFLRPIRDFIYTDTFFAVSSVASQHFIAEIRPDTLEYSLYSLTQVLCIMICNFVFLMIRRRLSPSLETWLIFGYSMSVIVPIWGCIGFSNVRFGFKMRWEFYVQLFVTQLSQAFANNCFRVLFSEMMPVGMEVRWFSLQVVLSCATVWLNYVASGPLKNATHELRFPLVLSLVFLLLATGIEVARCSLTVFRSDRTKWAELDKISSTEVEKM